MSVLSDEEFRLIRDIIRARYGLTLHHGLKQMVARRLGQRLARHGLSSFRDYYRFLRYAPAREQELEMAVELLTTNETYFFREAYQLKAFTEEILPEVNRHNAGIRRLRIWSAGCSTGEEPYTIAILVMEQGGWEEWEVSVLGSDINQRVLHAARQGVYGPSAFRATPPELLQRYFTSVPQGKQVKEEVRQGVHFSYFNLAVPLRVELVGEMDVIFCRNVLIYFDQDTRQRVVDGFYRVLREGGYLLLGHAESLMNISTRFVLRHLKHDLVYQKPQGIEGEGEG